MIEVIFSSLIEPKLIYYYSVYSIISNSPYISLGWDSISPPLLKTERNYNCRIDEIYIYIEKKSKSLQIHVCSREIEV